LGEEKYFFMKHSYFTIPLLAAALCSCTINEQRPSIEAGNIKVTAIDSDNGAARVRAILERDKAYIDSIKSPMLGEAAVALEKYIPESPLMNFAADALMAMAQQHSKEKIDIALTNKGGLRSNIAAGTITFGDVYNVFTFENRLAFLTLNGEQLTQLCKEIAKVGGEAISGMRLVITPNGELVGATVGGKAIKPQATYRIATLDYLSQGNDNLTTLAQGTDFEITKHLLRDLMVEYVNRQTAKGKKISAACDGRITIKE
jgi:2',3'-cyclic-nucleotide 2'-phosphodiesterase (5'-nucleotidase family)